MSDSQSESLFGSHNASILQQLLGVLSSAAKQEVKQKTRTSLLSTAFVKKKKHNNTSKRYRITQCKFDSYAFITNTFHTINANFRVVPPLKKKKKKPFFISSVTPQNSNASKRHIWSHIFGKYAIKSNSEVDASSTISVLYLMDLKLALHMPFFGCEQTEAHHKMVPRMYCTYADVVYPSDLSEIVRTRRRERWDR